MHTLIEHCKRRNVYRIGQSTKLLTGSPDLLCQALEGAGPAPSRLGWAPRLCCGQSLYNTITARVHTQSGLIDAFRYTTGIKQGCPLSPNLFKMYLDDLQAALPNNIDSDCPMLGDTTLPLLMYADDLTILSHSQEGLQDLMDALQAFYQSKHLTLNIEKTKAMVFSRTLVSLVLTYQGQHSEHVLEVRYLGLNLHQNKGFTFCTAHLPAAAQNALNRDAWSCTLQMPICSAPYLTHWSDPS